MATQKKAWDPVRQQKLAELLRTGKLSTGLSDSRIAGNEGQRQIGSGIVGDVFNILGRPMHAVSGAVYNTVDKNPNTTAVGGVTEGLTGHGQHNWAEILDQLGLHNRVAKSVLGFAGDVALDPLTYVGVKRVGAGMSATEAAAEAARQLSEQKVPAHLFQDAVVQRAAQIEAENPAGLYVTFAGKKITPTYTRPSQIASVIKDTLTGPEYERTALAKAFSRDAEMGAPLANKARIFESQSAAGFENHQHSIHDVFSHLTPDEANQVTFAMEKGQDLSHVLPIAGSRYGLNTLGDYQQLARRLLDKWWADEEALGLHQGAKKAENYVYKYYAGKIPENYPGLSPVAAARLENRTGRVVTSIKDLSLEDAAKVPKLEAVTDVAGMLEARARSHYRQIGRANLLNEGVKLFGVPLDESIKDMVKSGDYMKVGSDVLANPAAARFDKAEVPVYLPEKIIKVLNQHERVLTDDNVANQFMRWFDKVTHKWKFMNTMVNPGYWVRNSFSDGIMNFMDGVRNPKYYQQAFRTLTEHRQNNTAELLSLLDPAAEAGSVRGTKITFGAGTKNEIRIDAHDAWNGFLQGGGKSGDIITNITKQLDPEAQKGLGNYVNKSLQGAGSLSNQAGAKLADWNNLREDFWRLAHHYSVVDEAVKRGVPYEEAIMQAGKRVRKFNIDYGNLSTFERNSVRKVIPFYSWMRRNTPLQVELLLTRPGFIAGYSKANDLMQGLLGTDDGSGDYLVPKWIRDSQPVRIAMANSQNNWLVRTLTGAGKNQAAFMPMISSMTPFGDIQHLTAPVQAWKEAGGFTSPSHAFVEGSRAAIGDVMNMATPALKLPIEATTGENLFTGQKITNWQDWLTSQVSPGRMILNANPTGGINAHGLTSQFLGLQVQPVTATRQKGEFRRRQDIIQGMVKSGMPTTRAAAWKSYLRRTGRSVGA